ncbi:hypothetical protein T01_14068 [Trichinella spiralis]|uniref:Uncharacterized protein n=1 Tax=Trichinella spiralis TaxID=6334 RepID=A0A0V1B2W8_TRISP|nr:hypothetical protein T01_14068 [Trichinella spiralis]
MYGEWKLAEWAFFNVHMNEYESIRFNKRTEYELTLFYVFNNRSVSTVSSHVSQQFRFLVYFIFRYIIAMGYANAVELFQ